MKLVFHAIIPLPFWEWDDKSRIFMRFGHSKLGEWEVNCGDFKIPRYDCILTKVRPLCIIMVSYVHCNFV